MALVSISVKGRRLGRARLHPNHGIAPATVLISHAWESEGLSVEGLFAAFNPHRQRWGLRPQTPEIGLRSSTSFRLSDWASLQFQRSKQRAGSKTEGKPPLKKPGLSTK